jgi:hypothetical protein
LIAIQLQPSTLSGFSYVDDEPSATGAIVVSHGRLGSTYEARLRPDSGVLTATLQIPFSCSNGKDGVTVTLTWKSTDPNEPIEAKVVGRGY